MAPGRLLAGKLRIVRLLGTGGMGAVYEIEHEITKHRRALKVLHHDVLRVSGAVERFLREASAAGRIGDAHIVEAFDAGTLESGEPYVVLELLSGETLADRIEREGRLDISTAIDIVAQACDGIEAAHNAGIVHRDLKPENLFLVPRPEGPPFVKILDFGVSKFDAERTGALKLTGEGAAMGTPLYMSPEQVRSVSDVDGRADVYALGVILYECLTGQSPFSATAFPQLMLQIDRGEVIPLEERLPDAPAVLCKVLARAMATERDKRVPTARTLRAALRAIEASRLSPEAFADTAPDQSVDRPAPALDVATPPPTPAPDLQQTGDPMPDLRETAAPASTMVPAPARIAISDAETPSPAPGGSHPTAPATPDAVARDRRRGGAPLVIAAGAALAIAAVVLMTRGRQPPPTPAITAAPPPTSTSSAASPSPTLTTEPTVSAPHVEPAPPPAVTATASETAAPTASARVAPAATAPASAKPPASTRPANRADQAGLAKSPFR